MKKPAPPATTLPRDAALLLQRAAQTPLTRGPAPRMARTIAVEKAMATIRHQYPHLFQKEL